VPGCGPTLTPQPRSCPPARPSSSPFTPTGAPITVETWTHLLDATREAIDVLAFAGTSLHDAIPEFNDRLLVGRRRLVIAWFSAGSHGSPLRGRSTRHHLVNDRRYLLGQTFRPSQNTILSSDGP
jgi:hypothetical protein